jgi:2,5-diamino-6-(ribosylamino)-4(3H)-pyrimidinone 5'-phosphate reductase
MRPMHDNAAGHGFRVDRLWPDPAADLALDDAFADLQLPAARGRPWVAINMVTSVDGRAQLGSGAEGLGSRVDRRLMRLLRAGFDAVASGAGTLRATGIWPGLPDDLADRRVQAGRSAQPTSIVIAGRQPVPMARWHAAADQRRLLILGSDAPAPSAPDVEVLRAPTSEPDPGWLLDRLAEREIASVLLEGGPTTNASFLASGAIDEVFWTVGPMLIGSDALPMIAPLPGAIATTEPPRRGQLVSVHRNADELFLRYRFG